MQAKRLHFASQNREKSHRLQYSQKESKIKIFRLPLGRRNTLLYVGVELFSRAASHQVSSPLQSLTSVFGMGTGGPSALKTPTCVRVELSSRAASHQVFSPLQSLTSVFGMGTGGPSALKTRTYGAPSGIRTLDPLIKSQLLYQLS